jgi:8-oxo-dGTP pyrophosphatase MutT (NUDIX family)
MVLAMTKQWKTLESHLIAETKLFTLEARRSQADHEPPMDWYVLDAPDWVNVIAITDQGHVVLIEQYRHGTQQVTVEIPGGVIEPDETPLDSAQRELLEETGYQAEDWILLGSVRPNPAFLTNSCHTFLARGARRLQQQHLDEGEDISTLEVPITDIPKLIADGRIDHALVIAAFQWYWLRQNEEDSPPSHKGTKRTRESRIADRG